MNCKVWAYVDFGEGNVKVRCTQTGPHANHRVLVEISPSEPKPREDVRHATHNIFEKES